ncbi:MAG: hypothetical protein V9G04_10100 [Nocardioides sp.]|jgi:hypothetical protein
MGDLERLSPEPPERPEHERVPDYEIDLTGVVEQPASLIGVIQDAIVEAGPNGEVPEWGARAMARFLANMLSIKTSALHHYAVTGRIDLDPMLVELHLIWRFDGRSDFVTEAINRLGTYLLVAQRISERVDPDYPEQIKAALVEHGAPFEAFLQLPDIDPTNAEETLVAYEGSWAGSYWSIEAVLEDVAETLGLQQRLEGAGIEHFASVDPTKVMRLARDTYDIVEHDGRYFCFFK